MSINQTPYNVPIAHRFRRLRNNETLRKMVQEHHLSLDDLITPLFVIEGSDIKVEADAMPDIYRYSIDRLSEALDEFIALKLFKLLIFGIPDQKDHMGSSAYDGEGIVQKAVRFIKAYHTDFYVITDICLCQYTDHGHCGILDDHSVILNDETLPLLRKIALSHVEAGADMVAPSDMMDGRIGAIRHALDTNGYTYVPIMSYAIKYHSNYYGPFRMIADSSPKSGSRSSYQMDYHNRKETVSIANASIAQGADLIMVKPAMLYLDIVHELSQNIDKPLVVYNVSGEYAMMCQSIQSGYVSEAIIYETMIGFKRAGAHLIITYFSKWLAKHGL